jgi:hypothetical protein
VELADLVFDGDDLPAATQLTGAGEGLNLRVAVTTRDTSIPEAWGVWEMQPPERRRDLVLMLLVVDGIGKLIRVGSRAELRGHGLAEH